MNDPNLVPIFIAIGAIAVCFGGLLVMLRLAYVGARPGRALVMHRPGGMRVLVDRGAIVLPIVHRASFVDLTTNRIDVRRTGKLALVARDGKRVDVEASFFFRVDPLVEHIEKVSRHLGERAASITDDVVRELFEPKVTEAIKAVARVLDAREIVDDQERFRHRVVEVIGHDLDGFSLVDASVTHVHAHVT